MIPKEFGKSIISNVTLPMVLKKRVTAICDLRGITFRDYVIESIKKNNENYKELIKNIVD